MSEAHECPWGCLATTLMSRKDEEPLNKRVAKVQQGSLSWRSELSVVFNVINAKEKNCISKVGSVRFSVLSLQRCLCSGTGNNTCTYNLITEI